MANSRLIHFGTDCVFSGETGHYDETSQPTPDGIYGQSKLLGEVVSPHCLTLRTSIIGHEIKQKKSLLEWFLAQNEKVVGFSHAIYTGFPTTEIGEILAKKIIPNKNLAGLYHLSSDPISKYDLLKLISEVYSKEIEIAPSTSPRVNRSLNSERFTRITGYSAPSWETMVKHMKNFG